MATTSHKDDLQIGSAPAEGPCAQVGTEGYYWRAWHECRAFLNQLRRTFGREPPGCSLYVRENPHDFGVYLSVHCSHPSGDERGTAYARRCEAELPTRWDADARAELGLEPYADAPDAPKAGAPKRGKATARPTGRGRKGGVP